MTDLSDVNMEGVKPMGDSQELPIGQYLVRLEDNEKKETKEKYDEEGNKMPPNHYLQLAAKVYGGPNDGQVEFIRLNLWNTNPTAVNMAKSELKSIQDATNTHPKPDANNIMRFIADWFHGKWMTLEVKPNKKDPEKTHRVYTPAPDTIVAAFAHVPPVPAKAPAAATPAPQATVAAPATTGYVAPATATPASPPAAPSGAAGALPAWAQKKA